jgi:putative salt-induced outer membrane protein YdiY
MPPVRIAGPLLIALFIARAASAQAPATPPKEPDPLWDVRVAASFVGTSGNSDTSSAGADFAVHRRWAVWQVEGLANAVRASTDDVRSAERYLGVFRAQRKLTPLVGLSGGIKLERDEFSGIDVRSISDAGLTWALVREPVWTLEGTAAIALNHETRTIGTSVNDPVGLFEALSKFPLGGAGATTQRFTYYPDFKDSSAGRSEFEVTAQAAMNSHLALELGYLVRRSNEPVVGFKKTDMLTTASVVMQWKAAKPAP